MLIIGLISLLIAVPLFSNLITPSLNCRITSIVLIYAALLSFNGIYIQSIGAGVGLYSGLFQTNVITTGIEGFLLLLGAIILLSWDNNSIKSDSGSLTINEYSLIVLFTAIGSTFLISSYDLISMYLSIELQSFGLYILATLYRKSESATAAGLKYFLLGGLSSAIILLGTALIYSYTGITQFESLYSIVLISGLDSYVQPLILGFILITIGILFKVGASPFHNWAPDVYDGVPTVVTTWLTVIPKVSIFVFLVLLLTGLQGSFESFSVTIIDSSINVWKNVLLISSLLSLVIGTVLGLSQYRIKRLLAFSTISHVGFMLLALSVNTIESIEAFLFYIITYSITNLNAFLILLAFGYIIKAYNTQSKDVQFLHELKGQFNYNNVLSLSLALCLFSIAGVPPLVGFFAKQIVLYSSTHAGYYFISLVAILVSVISASYYLKIIKVLYFDTPEGGTDSPIVNITTLHSTMIAILSLAMTFFVLQPNTLLNSCQLLCLSLYYY